MHLVFIRISVAIDMSFFEAVGFDSLLECVSPLSGLRHVRIHEFAFLIFFTFFTVFTFFIFFTSFTFTFFSLFTFLILFLFKSWVFSELIVPNVVKDQTDLLIRLEVAADHTAVVKDLLCTLGNLLWSGAVKVQGFVIDGDLFTLFGTLEVRPPRTKYVSNVWEQDTTDVILGKLDSFEKLRNNP